MEERGVEAAGGGTPLTPSGPNPAPPLPEGDLPARAGGEERGSGKRGNARPSLRIGRLDGCPRTATSTGQRLCSAVNEAQRQKAAAPAERRRVTACALTVLIAHQVTGVRVCDSSRKSHQQQLRRFSKRLNVRDRRSFIYQTARVMHAKVRQPPWQRRRGAHLQIGRLDE